jgi:hypothetical protein
MLTEFEGTIDSKGLCMFRQRQESRSFRAQPAEQIHRVPFWAVLDVDSAIEVLQELKIGSRVRALQLLEELAFSLGTHWD